MGQSVFSSFFFLFMASKIMIRTARYMKKVKHGHVSNFQLLIYLGSWDICKKSWAIRSNILDIMGLIIMIWSVGSLWRAKNGYRLKNEPLIQSRSWDIYKNIFDRWCPIPYWLSLKLTQCGFLVFFVNSGTINHDPSHWIYSKDHSRLWVQILAIRSS